MLSGSIENLKKDVISYSFHTQSMIELSVKGLVERNEKLLNEVINEKEPIANKKELEIEETCITIIARYDPKAVDLRTVLMAMKINNDLERIADHAVNICEGSLTLINKPELKPLIDIPRMAEKATEMLNSAITAFIDENVDLADSVLNEDDVLDKYHYQLTRELLTYMIQDPSAIERSFLLMKISHDLERIGDLSTNICEDIIYMVDAKVIKHNSLN
ncbi:MAG: phosphate signaling complex protein PhoU [Candidatus Cloacimonetes bacterium]|nr:phosphate signaling complex protein PhoU [Candidatus Cloacimonadota bacterium]